MIKKCKRWPKLITTDKQNNNENTFPKDNQRWQLKKLTSTQIKLKSKN